MFTKSNFEIAQGIAYDQATSSKAEIINRQINDYEARYTYDLTDVKESLKGYNITTAEIEKALKKLCRLSI